MEVLMYAKHPTLDQSSVELQDSSNRPGYLVLALTMVLDGNFFFFMCLHDPHGLSVVVDDFDFLLPGLHRVGSDSE